MELIKIGEKTYYIKSPVNVGIYLIDDKNICLIDSGNSKDFGKVINQVLIENNWNLQYIINTHSHADHIGGNKYLQNKYNCQIFSNKIESYFINEPLLEPAMLYGANPIKEMLTHFLYADASECHDIKDLKLNGIEIIDLKGHSVGQIGVVTSDNICFVGDAYTSSKILEKYAIQYVYDIDNYLQTLNFLKNTNYKFYVPAHGEVESDCQETLAENIRNIENIEKEILNTINEKITYNDLLKVIFNKYHIKMNTVQYHLISTTIKSFLTKLEKDNKIEIVFSDNEMLLKII